MKYQKTKLSILITSILLGPVAFAAEADAPAKTDATQAVQTKNVEQRTNKNTEVDNEADVEKILVTGFKESLSAAEQNKREADTFIDAMSAEGLGSFADENVGDAMFSMPGVDIDFVSGSADGISIGGLPSEFNQVQINGASISAVNDGGDAVGEGARSLGPYSTAILSGLQIFKTARADQDEGSLGGTVNLKGWQPLNFKKTRFTVGITGGYQELSEETDAKMNFLYGGSTKDQRFGWVIAGAHEENKSREDRFTNGSQALAKKNLVADPDRVNETVAPGVFTYRMIQNDFVRDNLTSTLQFKVTDNLQLTGDVTYAKYERESLEHANNFGGLNQNANLTTNRFVDESVMEFAPYSDQGGDVERIATAGIAFSSGTGGGQHQMRHFQRTQTDEVLSAKLSADWIINQDWDMSAVVMYTKNTFEHDQNEMATQYYIDYRNVLWDMKGKDGLPEGYLVKDDAAINDGGNFRFNHDLYPTFNIEDRSTWNQIVDDAPLDPANYDFINTSPSNTDNETEKLNGQVDFTYYVDSLDFINDVRFGAKYSQEDTTFHREHYVTGPANGGFDGSNASWRTDWNLDDVGYTDSFGEFLGGHSNAGMPETWWASDWDATNKAAWDEGLGTWPGMGFDKIPTISRLPFIREGELNTLALYAITSFEYDDWIGNVGLRYVDDDYEATAYEANPNATPSRIFLNPQGTQTEKDKIAETGSTLDQDALAEWNNPDNFQLRQGGREEEYFLPSMNARYTISEDDQLFLRVAASRNMSRAPFTQTQATVTTFVNYENNTATVYGSNPELEPTFSNNYDLGLEWYPNKDLTITAAIRHKNLKNVRSNKTEIVDNGSVIDPGTGDVVDGLRVTYRIPEATGSGTVDSFEFGYRHNFTFLPSILANTGLNFNYSYNDSDVYAPADDGKVKLNGASPNAVNTQLFYQDRTFTARLAYTWRDPKLLFRETQSSLATWDNYRRNLNFSTSYKITPNFKATFNVQNVMDEESTRTIDNHSTMLGAYIYTGRRFLLGVNYTM